MKGILSLIRGLRVESILRNGPSPQEAATRLLLETEADANGMIMLPVNVIGISRQRLHGPLPPGSCGWAVGEGA